jgi:hypothetical protein
MLQNFVDCSNFQDDYPGLYPKDKQSRLTQMTCINIIVMLRGLQIYNFLFPQSIQWKFLQSVKLVRIIPLKFVFDAPTRK